MFENMTVAELKIAAKILGVQLEKATKKSDIVDKIISAGFSYEDYIRETESQFEYTEAEPKKDSQVVVNDETKSEEVVVLKMVYPRGALNVANKAYFSIEEPYKVFPKEKAEEIVRLAQGEVMLATPEEVASFYGVKR